MNIFGWIMLLFAIVVLFGGLAVCVSIAVRVDRRKREQGERFDDESD